MYTLLEKYYTETVSLQPDTLLKDETVSLHPDTLFKDASCKYF